MKKKEKRRIDVLAVHDGLAWRLCTPAGEIGSVESTHERLPPELLSQMRSAGCRSVRFIVSGEVYVTEGAIPKGMGFTKACETIKSSIAEVSGAESEGLIVAGVSIPWPGRRSNTYSGAFDGVSAGHFASLLEDERIVCMGFASLELALFAAWRERGLKDCAFAVVGEGNSFIIPPRRGVRTMPHSIPCGSRHCAADPETWVARLRRSFPESADCPFHVFVLCAESSPAIRTAMQNGGIREVVDESAGDLLHRALELARKAKANRVKPSCVPVANPYEPRRLFSCGWLIAAALGILMLPVACRVICERTADLEMSAISAESVRCLPLESRVLKARKYLEASRLALERENEMIDSRIAARRPLKAFIDVAYFFCRYVGRTTVLDSIRQNGESVEVSGFFSDPEDGVSMNERLLQYCKEKNIGIVKFESLRDSESENSFLYCFSVTFDCSQCGKEAAR